MVSRAPKDLRTGFVIIIVHFGADDITHPDYLFNLPASAENAFHLFPACGNTNSEYKLRELQKVNFSTPEIESKIQT